ncbi:MAG: hypothetical protein M3228_10980 [Actinomycetota bacterium]|nr:hypothetical protein [Actinomycetota bacterium]
MHNGQVSARAAKLAVTPPNKMFFSLREQLDNVREWNERRRWGLRADELDSVDLIPSAASSAENKPLVVDVLAVYLRGNDELNGVRRTCHELWTVAGEQQPHTWAWDWYWDKWMNSPKPVRLLDGIVHRPGVRRVTVDLGAHFQPGRHLRSRSVRGQDSAHAEVLAAAAHFPRWIRAMDGKTIPYTWVPGYDVMIRERPSPERLLALSWSAFRRTMSLTASWTDHAHSGWAAPTCER